jgi:hypothetical protein
MKRLMMKQGLLLAIMLVAGSGIVTLQRCVLAETETLEQRVQRGDGYAFREAADANRKDLIPALEKYASDPTARKALAKLGVRKYLDEIISELTTTNSARYASNLKNYLEMGEPLENAQALAEWWTRMSVFNDLAYIGDKSTVKVIASYLYVKEWKKPFAGNDVGFDPPSFQAVVTLEKMNLENAPDARKLAYPSVENMVKAWQQWWEQNKDKYP